MASVLSAGTTSNTALNLSADTTGILQFQTNGTTAAMTINTSQNVGIGTTSPNTLLHVYNATRALTLLGSTTTFVDPYASFAGQNISAAQVTSANTGGGQLHLGFTGTGSGISTGGINFFTTGTADTNERRSASITSLLESSAATNVTGNLIFFTTAAGTISEKMRIGSNGNVGIGTTSTSGARLQISSTDTAVSALLANGTINLREAASSSANNTVDLHIRPSSGKSGGITFTEDSVADRWSVGINNGVADLLFRSGAHNGTERMRLTSGGNVLLSTVGANINFATSSSSTVNYIGVPADGFSLELACQRGASQPFVYKLDFANGHVWSTAGSEKMRLSTGGQLGIAKSPAVTLDVNGAINFDANTTVNGLNVVYRATFNDNTDRQLSGVGWADTFSIFAVKGSGGTSVIPFFGNGGGGVSYRGTALDPDAGTWSYSDGPTITFTTGGTGGNTFTLKFNGGSGTYNFQRTAGSGSFTITIQQFLT